MSELTLTSLQIERLADATFHIGVEEAPMRVGFWLPVDGEEVMIPIRWTKTPALPTHGWDGVSIAGRSCGNRHGGRTSLIALVAGCTDKTEWWTVADVAAIKKGLKDGTDSF